MYEQVKNKSEKCTISVSSVLAKLGISKSGYHAYLTRKPCRQKQRKKEITVEIKKIHKESKEIYGSPKITKELQKRGYVLSQKFVSNIMRENQLKAHYRKKYIPKHKPTDLILELTNVLQRDFNPSKPNAYWCSDITYIWTSEGFVYLTSIMDLYSRKIIAWTLSETMEAKTVLQCLENAKAMRKIDNPVVVHSDQGTQYTSAYYNDITKDMIRSSLAKGNPWDNACIESFHASIKREWLNRYKIQNYNHAYGLVFEYIEGFYNTIRTHSHCGFESPSTYEMNYQNSLKTI